MIEIQCLIYLVLTCLSSIYAVGDDCPYKECSCESPQIYCQSLNLNYMPAVTSDGITGYRYLIMDQNNITSIPTGRLPSNLTQISLMNNPIMIIEEAAFDGSLNTLETLSFANARFTQIPQAFRRLHSLKQLSIYNTNVLDWDADSMKNIGQTIQTLNLENVGLTAWPEWLQYFSDLTELSIVQSSISAIPDNGLDHVNTSLTTLTITNSSLTSIPKTIASLKNLESLELLDNKISDITWMPQQSKLSSLSLNNNKITDASDISSALRPFAKTLSNVDLQGNLMTSIPDLSFLTNCGGFHLSHNHISNYASGSLPSGTYDLDLGHNTLASIPQMLSSLQSLSDLVLSWNVIRVVKGQDLPTMLIELDLGYNLISEITEASFLPNSTIISLLLNNNPINRISNVAFSNLPHLSELDLQYTKLTRLPLGLASLESLNSFDITNSTDLVCTCTEKDLATLFLRLQNVFGNCGSTSVYDFFSVLSSSCPS